MSVKPRNQKPYKVRTLWDARKERANAPMHAPGGNPHAPERFTTIYVSTRKRRATGLVESRGCQYTTKSLTGMHAQIRAQHPEAQTWFGVHHCITDFVTGVNTGTLPIVSGGVRIA